MITYLYDGSFEGLLSVVFEAYKSKVFPSAIKNKSVYQPLILDKVYTVDTVEAHAMRVITGVENRSSIGVGHQLYKVYLSEHPEKEWIIYQYIKEVLSASQNIEENYTLPMVLKVKQINKQIDREVHRMHAFVRFQKTLDGVYFATVAPDFNVIPLIGTHFENRYADQSWIIYDTKRGLGIYYDMSSVWDITLEDPKINQATGALQHEVMDVKELDYQLLWKSYFSSVNIQERKNIKLHLRHMPKTYWNYLIEKK
ncbi:MAG TPA: TIGR03915 family putative DNA repair protein [Cytophagales bacterium]|nr:TIGR03915 family putative DNA repair protein [Cytophagales bacterium]